MTKLTEEQKAELQALEEMSEEDIDFSDIPDRPVDWSTAQRGTMYQPVKKSVTLTLDEYVIEWFKQNEPDEKACQEAINKVLLNHVMRERIPNWRKAKEPAAREINP